MIKRLLTNNPFPSSYRMSSTWTSSEILTNKKSKFQGHAIKITNSSNVTTLLTNLVESNKAIQKSSHPTMYAFRIGSRSPNGDIVQKDQGLKDCGESGAGVRLMSVLEKGKLINVLVVVTRWYGGIPLGSGRFRDISSVAVEALKKGGFYDTDVTTDTNANSKDGSKKKNRKR